MYKLLKQIFISAIFAGSIFLFNTSIALGQCNAVADSTDSNRDCVPKRIFYTASNSTGSISNYLWVWGDGNVDSTVNADNNYTTAGVFNAMLIITCGAVKDTDFFTVTVQPLPIGSFTLSDDSLCTQKDTLFITNTSTPGFICTWNILPASDGVFIGTGLSTFTGFNPPGVKFFASGNKTIQLTVVDGSLQGCSNTFSQSVLVGNTPSPAFQLSDDTMCIPAAIQFFNNTPNASEITTWAWDFGDPPAYNSSVKDSPFHTFSTAGNYVVKLTTTTDFGCFNSSTKPFVALNTPTDTFSFIPTNKQVCAYSNATITYVGNAGGTATYVWDFGNNASPDSAFTKGPHAVNWPNGSPVKKYVTLTVSEFGCSNTRTDSITIRQVDTLTLTASDIDICTGDAVTFNAFKLGITNYNFFINGVSQQSSASPTFITSTLADNDVVSVVGTKNGCNTFPGNTITINVNIKPTVTVNDDDPNDSICVGTPVRFTATAGMDNYEFFVGFQSVQNSSSRFYDTDSLQNGQCVTVVATDNGCISDTSSPKCLTVITPLDVPVANCGATSNDSIQFCWDPVAGATSYTYKWRKNGGALSGNINTTSTCVSFTGLAPNDQIDIQVRSNGGAPCTNNFSGFVTCFAVPCSGMDFDKSADPSICLGDSTTLSISNLISPTAAKRYVSWNGGAYNLLDTVFGIRPVSSGTLIISVSMVDSSQAACAPVTKFITIDVNDIPAPAISHNDANDTICVGECITFSTTLTNYDNYRFFEGVTTYQNGANPNMTICTLGAGNHTISVEATDNGCTDIVAATTINVRALPNTTITLSNDSVCDGDVITATATPTANIVNFDFYVNGILKQIGGSNLFSYTFNKSSGDSIISVIATNNFGCSGLATNAVSKDTVKVLSLPSVNIAIPVPYKVSVANCDTVTFRASNAGAGMTYEWYIDDVLTFSSASRDWRPVITGGVHIVKVAAVSPFGCRSPFTDSTEVTVTLKPIFLSADIQNICAGDSVTFRSSKINGTQFYNFFKGVTLVEASSDTIFGTKAISNGDIFRVVAVDSGGCASDTSDPVMVSVSSIPTASIALTRDTICVSGDTINLKGLVTSGTLSWSDGGAGGTFTDILNDTTRYINVPGEYTLVLMSSNLPCAAVSDTERVKIWDIPAADAGISQTACQGIILSIDGTAANGNITWTTSSSGGSFDFNNIEDPDYTPDITDIGTYTLTMRVSNGHCADSISSTTIDVKSTPASKASVDVCAGDSALLVVDSAIMAIAGNTYSWGPGGQTTPQITISSSTAATYTLVVARNGCASLPFSLIFDKKLCFDELPVEIPQIITINGDDKNDFWFLKNISFFPNNKILIFNRWGQIVMRKDKYQNDWDGKNENGVELPTGTYYYVVDLGNGREVYKGFVMIQR